jgi:hypothetical protein
MSHELLRNNLLPCVLFGLLCAMYKCGAAMPPPSVAAVKSSSAHTESKSASVSKAARVKTNEMTASSAAGGGSISARWSCHSTMCELRSYRPDSGRASKRAYSVPTSPPTTVTRPSPDETASASEKGSI